MYKVWGRNISLGLYDHENIGLIPHFDVETLCKYIMIKNYTMKTKKLFLFCFCLIFQSISAQKQEMSPYLSFLEKQKTSSVDYVIGLFEKYDIVILGERDHRDTTQYELIEKIIEDPRFIKKVGNVFTEVGACNRTEWANRVLKGKYDSELQFEDTLRTLYREIDSEVIWEKYNYWKYLKSIHRINKDLPKKKKITVYFTDMAYDWTQCYTPEQRKRDYQIYFWGEVRDSIMGGNFVRYYNQILADKKQFRKKALVILNLPHAFRAFQESNSEWLSPAAHYIFQSYPGRVANVMINCWDPYEQGRERLISNGKWDAAFRSFGNPAVGFDLEGSPFGNEPFKLFNKPLEPLAFKDVVHGFVFYKPIEAWRMQIGVPGIIDEGYKKEYVRRCLLNHPEEASKYKDPDYLQGEIDYYNNVRTVDTYITSNKGKKESSRENIDKYINEWLE